MPQRGNFLIYRTINELFQVIVIKKSDFTLVYLFLCSKKIFLTSVSEVIAHMASARYAS